MTTLFDPLKIGALELRNRVVMAPLTRMRAFEERAPGPMNLDHYVQRAGAGLILDRGDIRDPSRCRLSEHAGPVVRTTGEALD